MPIAHKGNKINNKEELKKQLKKQILIFNKMKKQIFILVVLVLATFASVTMSYGQTAVHRSAPKALISCANDALHPIAGKPYDYKVNSTATGGNYTMWATTNQSFITAGVLQNTGANVLGSPDVVPTTAADYNGTNTTGIVQLTWGTDVLFDAMKTTSPVPTFVAAYSAGTSCADNLKVFQVEPINGFTVDITNVNHSTLNPLAYAGTEEQCFDKIQSSTWNAGAMVYNYGTNILIFEVVAANFSGSWTPTFTLSGINAAQNATMEWGYTTAFVAPVTVTSGAPSGTVVNTAIINTSNGVSIFVKVTVSNQTYEGLSALPITLSVTGTNSAGQRDVLATTCADASLASNSATQTLNERPDLTNNGTAVGDVEMP